MVGGMPLHQPEARHRSYCFRQRAERAGCAAVHPAPGFAAFQRSALLKACQLWAGVGGGVRVSFPAPVLAESLRFQHTSSPRFLTRAVQGKLPPQLAPLPASPKQDLKIHQLSPQLQHEPAITFSYCTAQHSSALHSSRIAECPCGFEQMSLLQRRYHSSADAL